jgi:hypothetical protein
VYHSRTKIHNYKATDLVPRTDLDSLPHSLWSRTTYGLQPTTKQPLLLYQERSRFTITQPLLLYHARTKIHKYTDTALILPTEHDIIHSHSSSTTLWPQHTTIQQQILFLAWSSIHYHKATAPVPLTEQNPQLYSHWSSTTHGPWINTTTVTALVKLTYLNQLPYSHWSCTKIHNYTTTDLVPRSDLDSIPHRHYSSTTHGPQRTTIQPLPLYQERTSIHYHTATALVPRTDQNPQLYEHCPIIKHGPRYTSQPLF